MYNRRKRVYYYIKIRVFEYLCPTPIINLSN